MRLLTGAGGHGERSDIVPIVDANYIDIIQTY